MPGQDAIGNRWLSLLRLLVVSGRDDGDHRSKGKRLTINIASIVWYLYLMWKQALSTRTTGLPEYYVGSTITRIGNIHDMAEVAGATGILFCASFRLIVAVPLVAADAKDVVVQSLADLDGESFACPAQRRKEKLAGILYKGTVTVSFARRCWAPDWAVRWAA